MTAAANSDPSTEPLDAPEPACPGVSRRNVLRALGIGAAAVTVPAGLSRAAASTVVRAAALPVRVPTQAKTGTGTFVLLTLYGGNDGLNTIIPYSDSAYLSGRGSLAFTADQVLKLDDQWGLNPSLAGIKALWDRKRVAIVRGVGYPNPNRSHFRSMDIWQSAVADSYEATGWLGRWHDATGADPLRMVNIGASLPRTMIGTKGGGAALPIGQLTLSGGVGVSNAFAELHRGGAGAELGGWGARIGAAGADLLRVQQAFGPILTGAAAGAGAGGTSLEGGATANGENRTELDDQFDQVAKLIKGGAPTRAYGVSLGGFDTHASERDQHLRLLKAVDQGITRFFAGFEGDARGDGVTVLVHSEFGRRVGANSSNGTDHGTAAPVLVIGPSVKGGYYGDAPSLTDLDQGDLKFTTDFRSIYASILGGVLGLDPAAVLGKSFAPVPLL